MYSKTGLQNSITYIDASVTRH